MVGRPAVPREIKKAKGTLQNCRDKPTLQLTEIDNLEIPDYFDENQISLFKLVTTELKNAKVLATVDLDMIILLCNEYKLYYKANEKCIDPVTVNHLGNEMMSPWVTIKNGAINNIIKMVAHLGLSPAARSRIKMGAVKEDNKPKDPAAKLIGTL
jgi:P27 family predicted phage terminase small subunit